MFCELFFQEILFIPAQSCTIEAGLDPPPTSSQREPGHWCQIRPLWCQAEVTTFCKRIEHQTSTSCGVRLALWEDLKMLQLAKCKLRAVSVLFLQPPGLPAAKRIGETWRASTCTWVRLPELGMERHVLSWNFRMSFHWRSC